MASSDILPTFRHVRGKKEHGSFTVGLTAVLLQAENDDLLSLLIQNDGPGKLRVGTSTVSTSNTPGLAVGDAMVIDRSSDPTWIVSDQANTTGMFLREVEV